MDFSQEVSDFRLVISFIIDQVRMLNSLMWSHFALSLVLALFIISAVVFVFVRLRDK